MGLFGGSKSSSTSKTYNYQYNYNQSLGDLSSGNVQAVGDVQINGLWGEDMALFLDAVESMTTKATESNSNLAGQSIAEVAKSYQSAYSETTGILQQLKPVLMVGAGILAIVLTPKILKGL